MKLKYYLRGLGIGMIVTTLILMICFSFQKNEISDEEIKQRAAALGMVMPDSETVENGTSADSEVQNSETAQKTTEETGTKINDGQQIDSQEQESAVSKEQNTKNSEQKESETDVSEQVAEAMAQQGETYRLQVQRGQVCRTICDTLAENGIIEDSELFRQYLSQIGYASQISIGTYEIPYGLTMDEVAEVLQAGPIEKQQ